MTVAAGTSEIAQTFDLGPSSVTTPLFPTLVAVSRVDSELACFRVLADGTTQRLTLVDTPTDPNQFSVEDFVKGSSLSVRLSGVGTAGTSLLVMNVMQYGQEFDTSATGVWRGRVVEDALDRLAILIKLVSNQTFELGDGTIYPRHLLVNPSNLAIWYRILGIAPPPGPNSITADQFDTDSEAKQFSYRERMDALGRRGRPATIATVYVESGATLSV